MSTTKICKLAQSGAQRCPDRRTAWVQSHDRSSQAGQNLVEAADSFVAHASRGNASAQIFEEQVVVNRAVLAYELFKDIDVVEIAPFI